jgi:tetratricopeptide (TPR) repeat protein
MDALKKAEQEKREAARRLEEAREKTHGASPPEAPPDPDITAEMEVVAEPPPAPPPVELSLEPRGSVTGPMALVQPPAPEAAPEPEQTGPEPQPAIAPELLAPAASKEKSTALEFVEEIGPEGMASFDQTFHGVAIGEGAVPGLFDETLPGTSVPQEPQRSYDQTLPGVPAAQLARDIGTADQPTPAAAQTVFTAGHARQPDRLYRWGLPAAGVALLLAASIYIYYSTTPVAPNTPSPWVARGIEAVPPPAEPLLPPAAAQPAETPPAAESGIEAAAVVAEAGPVSPELPAGQPVAAPESAPPAEAVPTPEPAPVAEEVPAPPAAEAPAARVAEATPAAPAAEAPASLVRISRSRSASEQERMLREAYAYYRSGDYETATIHYLAVLNDRPDTLDALLGMGAIALKQGDLRRAAEYFSQVLKLDPRNQTAAAALIGLQGSADPIASESALKFMLQENPDNPFLHFTLGNVYASQLRWSEAQQAFFDAYRNDSSNPDYALNLAASLDRLGQSQPALDYYSVALKLAENQAVGFDAARVRARIETLSASGRQAQ